MSLLCSTNCRNQCRNNGGGSVGCSSAGCGSAGCSCAVNCECNQVAGATCSCSENQVAGAETEAPVTVRALLQTVLDSCCTTDDVCREITVDCPDIFNPCELVPGSVLSVELDGDITFKEVNRDKDNCSCVSSVRFNIPVRIYGTSNSCCNQYITRNITVIRSVRLCCANDSELTANNSRVIAISAVVTEVCGSRVTFTLCLLFRSCLQQTILREYSWDATPVCVSSNCTDARSILSDSCDTTCGCVAGAKTCSSCD